MDYTQFAGLKVRIKTKDNEVYEGLLWGFQFDNEIDENVLEVWMEEYIFDVADILGIEVCKEPPSNKAINDEGLFLN
ncbi:MAG TPA: hypothetical protein PLQ69_01070 [Paludibacter sp.]|nr:hypothetical protein [Paludibacter sp.]